MTRLHFLSTLVMSLPFFLVQGAAEASVSSCPAADRTEPRAEAHEARTASRRGALARDNRRQERSRSNGVCVTVTVAGQRFLACDRSGRLDRDSLARYVRAALEPSTPTPRPVSDGRDRPFAGEPSRPLAATGYGPAESDGPGGAACDDPAVRRLVELVNEERARQGAQPVRCDDHVSKIAQGHSDDMCARGYFDHVSPEGQSPGARALAAGLPFRSYSENIAVGYRSVEDVHRGFMNSPGHRENLLDPSHGRLGIGLNTCHGQPYWTENFAD